MRSMLKSVMEIENGSDDDFKELFNKIYNKKDYVKFHKDLINKKSKPSVAKTNSKVSNNLIVHNGIELPLDKSDIKAYYKNSNGVSSGYGSVDSAHVKPHKGIDIPAQAGSSVFSTINGKVTFRGWRGGYGNAIIITDSQTGKHYLFGHNQAFTVSMNDDIKKGDQIAKVGTSGNSTGPHIHYEVLDKNWNVLNPYNSMKYKEEFK